MIVLQKLSLAVVALISISGCASVTRGTKDTLVVESIPAGAEVRLSTGGVGRTPTSFKLPRKHALEVFIEKEGYEPLTVHVSSQVSGSGAVGVAGNVLIGGIIGIGIDSATGAAKDLRPNPIKVTMVPLKPKETPTQSTDSAPTVAGQAESATATTTEVANNGALPDPNAKTPPPTEFKPAGIQVRTLYVAKGLDPVRVRDTIASALVAREWEVTEKADNHVVGHIKQRRSEAFLTLVIESGQIRFYCEGWKIEKSTGTRLKPQLPDSWIDNIKDDLTERLAQGATGQ